ncbi:hypothetical protein N0V95_004812 [Ascochyta clinopodiicola]|nr:hypothetical protein N0V95_004812 [Ascochyta clinopodiicola]
MFLRTTLSPAELSKIANRSRRQSLASGPSGCVSFMSSVEKTPQVRLQKVSKRKQQQGIGEDFEHHDTLKRSRMKALTGPRMTASIVNLSDDDTAEPLIVPNSRHSAPRSKFQQQTLVSPNVVSRTLLVQTSAPEVVGVNNSHFTPDQARRIQFVWKIDYEGMEHDAMRTLDEASTFRGLLETFREEAQSIPSATRQIKSDLWSLKYKMTDGTGNAVLINLKRPQFELHFVHLLRGLAEKKGWQEDQDVTVEIELKATMPGVFK